MQVAVTVSPDDVSNDDFNETFCKTTNNCNQSTQQVELSQMLTDIILCFGPDVFVTYHKQYLAFHRRSRFITIAPRKERIDIGLVLPSLIFTPRFMPKSTLHQQKITHCVYVRHPHEINEELRLWLRTAYEMNQPPSNL